MRRFALHPFSIRRMGLTAEEVVTTLCQAAESAEQETGVVTRLLLCTLRHYSGGSKYGNGEPGIVIS